MMGRKPRSPSTPQSPRWSQRVTSDSDALDLEPGVFTRDDPLTIAQSLKASAGASQRRKSTPFRSAMSMLNFYINRACRLRTKEQLVRLEAAKDDLRVLNGRPRKGPMPKAEPGD